MHYLSPFADEEAETEKFLKTTQLLCGFLRGSDLCLLILNRGQLPVHQALQAWTPMWAPGHIELRSLLRWINILPQPALPRLLSCQIMAFPPLQTLHKPEERIRLPGEMPQGATMGHAAGEETWARTLSISEHRGR